MPYSQLSQEHITKNAVLLHERIAQSFPDRNLRRVGETLVELSRSHVNAARKANKPRPFIRASVVLLLVGGLVVLAWIIKLKVKMFGLAAEEFNNFEGIEAIVNMLVLIGAGTWFLFNLETRAKREFVLEKLHQLRSLAHVVDMFQIAKDPVEGIAHLNSDTSDKTALSHRSLMLYLGYCIEMLSLTGKLSALYMQNMRDPVVIQAVTEVEDLTNQFCQKIWQKIQIARLEASEILPPIDIDLDLTQTQYFKEETQK